MSRSYRKPYTSWACYSTIKQDRIIAARCFRRLENESLRKVFLSGEFEEYMHPVQYEARHNNPYSWSCDGLPHFEKPPEFNYYWMFLFGEESAWESFEQQLEWYEKLKRK
jgi:hypothetical protein